MVIDKEIKIIKNFGQNNNVMQLRAGKLGDDKLFIIYAPTTTSGSHRYGNVPRGTVPRVFVIELPNFIFKEDDKQIEGLLMNTNEEIRTFQDGVLNWATSNSNGNLTINKVGIQRLDKSYEDINYILSQNDLKDIDCENCKNKNSLSGGAIFAIVLFTIIGCIILIIGVFLLYKYINYKKTGKEFNLTNIKNEMLLKY